MDLNRSSHPTCGDCTLQTAHAAECCSLQNDRLALSGKQLCLLAFIVYFSTIQLMRFKRSRRTAAYVRSHQPLTPIAAQPVVHTIAQLEFPMLYQKALEFALFRTYGIPTISKLLQQTSLFSTASTAGRRYVDTKVLIGEFISRKWASPEWIRPMARLNAIHGHYRAKGQILESDMLYTLLLFAQQIPKWIDRFDWRPLTHEERDALGVFWQGVSEAMEINYDGLGLRGWEESAELPVKANGRGTGTWKDGADWLKAVDEWAERYEERHMVPAESNAAIAEQTVRLLLYEVPDILQPFGRQAISALMDARLRRAMMIPPPPTWVHCTVITIMKLRQFVLRWLLPPRPNSMRILVVTETEDVTDDGRHHIVEYENLPYFVKPSFWKRWGVRAWMRWSRGLPLPGDDGMEPDGYVPVAVGPPVGKAKAEQERREVRVEEVLAGRGCPLAFTS